jgi:FMN phosphatase YigB (HAD superfamily)
MEDAGAIDPKQCYLVDDSAQNIDAAQVCTNEKKRKVY